MESSSYHQQHGVQSLATSCCSSEVSPTRHPLSSHVSLDASSDHEGFMRGLDSTSEAASDIQNPSPSLRLEHSMASQSSSPPPFVSPYMAESQSGTWGAPSESVQSQGITAGQEYQCLVHQKARGEERLKALLTSKEHARRAYPRIRRIWQDYCLKIMVAGEAGHGKTTFINNTFMSYCRGKEVKPHDGSRTSMEEFLRDPSTLCTRFAVENNESLERVHYTIQDTPGYGDDCDVSRSIDMITSYIENQNEAYLRNEKDFTRTTSLQPREDPRVDVCLYFIAAHRLKHIDVKFMQAISQKVAVIPCIAKADSMTADETVQFRRYILEECERHNIKLFDFGDDAKAAVGIPADLLVPPFAVVASNRFDEVRGGGSFWPVRDYAWGTCEAFSTQHSDCTYLKRLILEEGFHELRRETEDRYLSFRRDYFEKAQVVDAGAKSRTRRLSLLMLSLVLLCGGLWGAVGGPGAVVQGLTEPLAAVVGAPRRDEVSKLSTQLKKKEHQLEMAEHKIDLLVKSVRDLEESMARLATLGSSASRDTLTGGTDRGGSADVTSHRNHHDTTASTSTTGASAAPATPTTNAYSTSPSSSSAASTGSPSYPTSGCTSSRCSGGSGTDSSAPHSIHRCGGSHDGVPRACEGVERGYDATLEGGFEGPYDDASGQRGSVTHGTEYVTQVLKSFLTEVGEETRFVDGRTKGSKWFFS